MYWIMDGQLPLSAEGEALLEFHNDILVPGVASWKRARPLGLNLDEPLQIEFDTYRGYQGPPVELYDVGAPLMSERLARALLGAGVETLELFPTILIHRGTGTRYAYYVYNVSLMMAAADMGRSVWQAYDRLLMYDVSFYELVLDESKCQGELLFRLGQNVNALVVHDSVREAISQSGIGSVTFTAPEQWMQL